MYEEKSTTITIRISKTEKELINKALEKRNIGKPWYSKVKQSEFLREIIQKECEKLLKKK